MRGAASAAFREGLSEAGFVDGRNVRIDFHWAEGQYDRLPAMAKELVGQQVALIVAGGLHLRPANILQACSHKTSGCDSQRFAKTGLTGEWMLCSRAAWWRTV